jgi:hypothetical protein
VENKSKYLDFLKMSVLETKLEISSIERFFFKITDGLCELNIKDEVKKFNVSVLVDHLFFIYVENHTKSFIITINFDL